MFLSAMAKLHSVKPIGKLSVLTLFPSLRAGSRWSTSARGEAVRSTSSGDEKVLASLHQTPSRRIALLFAAADSPFVNGRCYHW